MQFISFWEHFQTFQRHSPYECSEKNTTLSHLFPLLYIIFSYSLLHISTYHSYQHTSHISTPPSASSKAPLDPPSLNSCAKHPAVNNRPSRETHHQHHHRRRHLQHHQNHHHNHHHPLSTSPHHHHQDLCYHQHAMLTSFAFYRKP